MIQLTKYDIDYHNYLNIFIWINKHVKEIAKQRNKYYDYFAIDKSLTVKNTKNIKEINIDIDLNTIIILITYSIDKPYKVIFCQLFDEIDTHNFYINKSKN